MMKIGTAGFRGIIGDEFTKENVTKIIQCMCNIIDRENLKREVLIGYDNRFMSEVYAEWISEVLVGNNVKVKLTNTSVPTPLVSFMTKKLNLDFGVMITASHNPYFYNGLKIFSKLGREVDKRMEDIFNSEPETITEIKKVSFKDAVEQNMVEKVEYTKNFVDNIISLLKFKDNFDVKAIYNVMNGSSLNAVMELKKQLNLKNLDIVNTNRDALFNLGGPIPTEENLQEYKDFALKNKYEFAFATDGDGDRIAVFDENGKFYNGNELNALIYYFMLKEKGMNGAFVKNYSFSTIIDKIANKFGTNVVETKVGFKYVTEGLIENDALIGAENSGSEVKGHVYVKDGLVVFALLLEIIEFYKKPLSKIFDDVKKFANYDMAYIEYSFKIDNKEKIIEYLQKNDPKFTKKIAKKGTLDGFKYIFEDGTWILIRFSGTENLIRLVIEENTQKDLDKLLQESIKIVEDIAKN